MAASEWLDTARFLALREQGKASYLMTLDVARACTRRLGADLVTAGSVWQPDDVLHLSALEPWPLYGGNQLSKYCLNLIPIIILRACLGL